MKKIFEQLNMVTIFVEFYVVGHKRKADLVLK